MIETLVTLPLLAKAAPILIPVTGALMKHLIGDDKKLYQELLAAFIDEAGDVGKDQLAEVLKKKPDLTQAINDRIFLRYTGWVLGQLIRQFAGKPQFESHKDELMKLADVAPEGWITFVKRGSPGLTLVQREEFLRELASCVAFDGKSPAIEKAPFITFFNWHVRMPEAMQQQLDGWLKSNLEHALKVLVFEENPESVKTWKQNILNGLKEIRVELSFIRDQLIQHEDLIEDLRESPGFDLRHYAEKLVLHCERIPFSSKAENKGTAPIKLSTIFVEPSLRSYPELDPELLAASRDVANAVRDGTINQLTPEQRQIALKLEETQRQAVSAPAFQTLYESRETGHIILAHAGVGKSSLVRRMALRWAVQAFQTTNPEAPEPLPILIELKTFANAYGSDPSLSLLAFLHQCEESFDRLDRMWCMHYLRTGAAVLILDGLDEVSQTETRIAIANGASRLRRFGARVIVTSRREGFKADHWQQQTTPWAGWLLEEFSHKQRDTFIGLMLPRLYASDGEWKKKQAELERRFKQQSAIGQLSTNPLLLTLITILQRTGRLGDNRLALYKEAAELLLDQWEAEHFGVGHTPLENGIPCDADTRREIIRHLARKLVDPDGPGEKYFAENLFSIEIFKEAIREVVDPTGANPCEANMAASKLPDYLNERHSVVCFSGEHAETNERLFSFIHRTFLEYFIALAWVEEIDNENAGDTEICRKFLMDKNSDKVPRWRDARFANILPFYFGLLSEKFQKKRLPLLWEITSLNWDDNNSQILIPRAILFAATVWSEMPSTRDRKHPEFGTALQYHLQIVAERTPNSPGWPFSIRNNSHPCREAVQLLAQLFGTSPNVEDWLRKMMEDNACPNILRSSCAIQLHLLHGSSPEMQDFLLKFATLPDTHPEFRNTALRILAENWGEECLVSATLRIQDSAKLEELLLTGCSSLSKLPDLQQMTGLKKLDLSGCTGFQNAEAITRLQSYSCLEDLNLADCTALQELPDMQHMSGLKKLNLRNCTGLKSAEALSGILYHSGLEDLNLANCTPLQELPDMQHMSGLKKLSLTGCTGFQNAEALSGILYHFGLEDLNLTGCTALPQLPDMQQMKRLKRLHLAGCTGFQNAKALAGILLHSGLELLNLANCTGLTQLPDMQRMTGLKTLDLRGCTSFRNTGALVGMQSLSGLESLCLAFCKALPQLPDMQRITGLKSLDISGCSQLKNIEGLMHSVRLQRLVLLGCSGLTSLPDFRMIPDLKHLDLDGCTGLISDNALDGLVELSHLELLDIRNCPELKKLPDLKHLTSLKQVIAYGCSKLLKETELKKRLPQTCVLLTS